MGSAAVFRYINRRVGAIVCKSDCRLVFSFYHAYVISRTNNSHYRVDLVTDSFISMLYEIIFSVIDHAFSCPQLRTF